MSNSKQGSTWSDSLATHSPDAQNTHIDKQETQGR